MTPDRRRRVESLCFEALTRDADLHREVESLLAGHAEAAGFLETPAGGAPPVTYLVIEHLEGQTLRQRLKGEPLPVGRALDYAQQVAQGLAAAHDKGIVHRDLKSENLFVTDEGRVPSAELFWASAGLEWVLLHRGEFRAAGRLAERCLQLAQTQNDPALSVWAHRGAANTLAVRGDWKEALAHYEEGLAIYEAQPERASSAYVTLLEQAVLLRALAATNLWALGWPDNALRQSQEAVAQAEVLSLPATVASAVAYHVVLRVLGREVPAALERAERLERLAGHWGFAWYGTIAILLRGWCLAQQRRSQEAVGLLRAFLVGLRTSGLLVWKPLMHAVTADAYLKAGATQEALDLLEDARIFVENTGERQWEAEVLRVRAEALLSLGDQHQAEAERLFRQAIDVARHQETKSFELRAVTGLSRLLQSQGRRDEARRMLADLYGRFTEGFDTSDLREARALLDELG